MRTLLHFLRIVRGQMLALLSRRHEAGLALDARILADVHVALQVIGERGLQRESLLAQLALEAPRGRVLVLGRPMVVEMNQRPKRAAAFVAHVLARMREADVFVEQQLRAEALRAVGLIAAECGMLAREMRVQQEL